MQQSQYSLTAAQRDRLRARHPAEIDQSEVLRVAKERGWMEANIQFLGEERARGARAMRDLMHEVGADDPQADYEVIQLVRLACQVFTPDPEFQGLCTQLTSHSLRITAAPCPVYQALERRQWRGMTACPSWHQRRGWLDALGAEGTISVEAEMKWGDPACVAVVNITGRREED